METRRVYPQMENLMEFPHSENQTVYLRSDWLKGSPQTVSHWECLLMVSRMEFLRSEIQRACPRLGSQTGYPLKESHLGYLHLGSHLAYPQTETRLECLRLETLKAFPLMEMLKESPHLAMLKACPLRGWR